MLSATDSGLGESLSGFRRAQKMAYDAAVEVAAELVPGTTEREAAARLEAAITARGVRHYFHQPFAWFGKRSRFAGFRRISVDFFPTNTALEAGMVGILDVAPIVDGFTADIGYTFACGGKSEALKSAMATLREVRDLIPACVARGDTMRSIYVRVERLFVARGYENRHARYPFGVLGHRVEAVSPRMEERRILGFGTGSLRRLLGAQIASRLPGLARPSPLWNKAEAANRPLPPGLWAVEPHLGARDFGAKFEELLVVEPHRAYWLDDTLPHVVS